MHILATMAVSLAMLGVTHGTATNANNAHTTATQAHKASQTVTPVKPAPVMVTVQPGDTLSSIAAVHGSTYIRLFDANTNIADPDVIDVGQQLRIPTADEPLASRPLPADAPAPTAVSATTAAPVSTPATSTYAPVSGNAAKAMIYARESGNNPNSTSASGCYGLGQDCNGRVRAQCGADYACQDAYFTNYAISRYGSWAAAAAFWNTHGWW